jgi:hypothetical protein
MHFASAFFYFSLFNLFIINQFKTTPCSPDQKRLDELNEWD